MGTKDFPPNGRCPCGSRLPSARCHRLGPEEEAELEAATIKALLESGVDPAMVYAYERTHLIITREFRVHYLLEAASVLVVWVVAIAVDRELHPSN